MLTLKKVKELVEAPSHAKRTPSPKMLYEEGIVLLRREFDQGSHLTVYNSGYVLFSAGKRNTVFHIHDCCGDYAYDAAEGKGDVIEEEYFENCEWHIRALFEGERKMEDNQAKCEGAGRSNVCVSYHALSEDWSEIADRTINMLEKIIENQLQNQENSGCGRIRLDQSSQYARSNHSAKAVRYGAGSFEAGHLRIERPADCKSIFRHRSLRRLWTEHGAAYRIKKRKEIYLSALRHKPQRSGLFLASY